MNHKSHIFFHIISNYINIVVKFSNFLHDEMRIITSKSMKYDINFIC